MNLLEIDRQILLAELRTRGVATSSELQGALGKSQPTVSRLLAGLSAQVLAIGRGRGSIYGLARPIIGLPASHALWWIDEAGTPVRIGTLHLLGDGSVIHTELLGFGKVWRGRLPWFLAPLQARGFLGRLLARQLAGFGLPANPESWNIETVLFAALQLHDAPGAIVLGEPAAPSERGTGSARGESIDAVLDSSAQDVALSLPAGSSAGGEQPKFLARVGGGDHQLVKFTPLLGTPFGDRWRDLLRAESLAADVLRQHGVPVAAGRIVDTAQRSYLVSPRFDRIGATGRRHAVAIGACHEAFVPGPYSNWAASCEALESQGRLVAGGGAQARALLEFGRLIGNSDMHSGNLSLFVGLGGLASGGAQQGLSIAPVYDMLPMRWRPDALTGGAGDYAPFEPDPASAAGPARSPAAEFWHRLAADAAVSRALRRVAAEMARRLGT